MTKKNMLLVILGIAVLVFYYYTSNPASKYNQPAVYPSDIFAPFFVINGIILLFLGFYLLYLTIAIWYSGRKSKSSFIGNFLLYLYRAMSIITPSLRKIGTQNTRFFKRTSKNSRQPCYYRGGSDRCPVRACGGDPEGDESRAAGERRGPERTARTGTALLAAELQYAIDVRSHVVMSFCGSMREGMSEPGLVPGIRNPKEPEKEGRG